MTYPRKTAAITACASAAGARTPHLTRPASARRPRNDASDTAVFDGDLSVGKPAPQSRNRALRI